MNPLKSNYVYGYYGCDSKTALKILNEIEMPQPIRKRGDWFGPTISFCEDPYWAYKCVIGANKTYIKNPVVIGALIDLGLCLYIRRAFSHQLEKAPLVDLEDLLDVGKGRRNDQICPTTSFDTIRCVSCYSKSIYRGNLTSRQCHQIRVINPDNIKGYFQL